MQQQRTGALLCRRCRTTSSSATRTKRPGSSKVLCEHRGTLRRWCSVVVKKSDYLGWAAGQQRACTEARWKGRKLFDCGGGGALAPCPLEHRRVGPRRLHLEVVVPATSTRARQKSTGGTESRCVKHVHTVQITGTTAHNALEVFVSTSPRLAVAAV